MMVKFSDVKRGAILVGGYYPKPGTPDFQRVPSAIVLSARNVRTGVRRLVLSTGETFEFWTGGNANVQAS